MTNRQKYKGMTMREIAEIYISTYGINSGMGEWLDRENLESGDFFFLSKLLKIFKRIRRRV